MKSFHYKEDGYYDQINREIKEHNIPEQAKKYKSFTENYLKQITEFL